jgi:long-subunit fatty acid transport protein
MFRICGTAGTLALVGTAAWAGGVERSAQSMAILFEDGNYAEFSLGAAAPDVSGSTNGAPFGSFPSGDMAGDYGTYSLGYKQALSDRLDLALILDQPIGADVDYPSSGSYALRGTTAELDSTAITGLLRYKLPASGQSRLSAFGGVRFEQVSGNVTINFPPAGVVPYTLSTNTDRQAGFVVGMAWERPDIAARVAVTYNSAISHTLAMSETVNGSPPQTTDVDVEVPQSLNVEFQTGVAKDTLLFGSVRWVDWTQFKISPPLYGSIFGSNPDLVSYQHDRITYNLGLGHRFSDTWSGAVTLGYEPSNGDVTGNLGPTDGLAYVGVGATYTQGRVKITGGLRYIEIGGANTTIGARFRDNSAIAAGVKVGFSF